MDYYPYGKTLRSYTPTTPPERYQSTHNERDSETNYDHREARNSDSDWGRFLGVDALADKYPSFSPYCYVGGNPVILADPSGKWIPSEENGKIKLFKEEGDNMNTFLQFFKGSHFSQKQLTDAYNAASGSAAIVTLPADNFSRAFTYASEHKSDFANDTYSSEMTMADNYNCYHFAFNGATGGEIYDWSFWPLNNMIYSDYMIDIEQAYTILTESASTSTQDNLVYGQTILAFYPNLGNPFIDLGKGKKIKNYQHVGVFAGKDKAGNIYIMTKDGSKIKPKIRKLSPVEKENNLIDFFINLELTK